MILSMLLAAASVVPISLASPRQAEQFFGRRFGPADRRRLRWLGFALVIVSLELAWADIDRARALITWFGVLGAAALVLSLAFTLLTAGRSRRAIRPDRRGAASGHH